jgi:quercetin dioxygenase-like cupin family protein
MRTRFDRMSATRPEVVVFNAFQADATQGVEVLPGTWRHTKVLTDRVQINFTDKRPGSVTPVHTHPGEFVSLIIRGRYRDYVGDEIYELGPGDVLYLPEGGTHGPIELIGDELGVRIDILCPPRGEEKALS